MLAMIPIAAECIHGWIDGWSDGWMPEWSWCVYCVHRIATARDFLRAKWIIQAEDRRDICKLQIFNVFLPIKMWIENVYAHFASINSRAHRWLYGIELDFVLLLRFIFVYPICLRLMWIHNISRSRTAFIWFYRHAYRIVCHAVITFTKFKLVQ